jgi:Na+/H+-dicarboxylate symporter
MKNMDSNQQTTGYLATALPAGIVIGVILGFLIPDIMLGAEFVGRLYLNLILLLIIPVIVAATVAGMGGLGRLAQLGSAFGRLAVYFLATSAIAVVLGLVSAWIFAPGNLVGPEGIQNVGGSIMTPTATFGDLLSGVMAGNFMTAVSTEGYLGLVLVSLFLGVMLASMGNAGRTAMSFFRSVNEALQRVVGLLLYAAPIGFLFLVGGAVARGGASGEWISAVGWLVVALAVAMVIHAAVVLPLILSLVVSRSPMQILGAFGPALWTAFGLGSSAATLPVTYRCAIDSGQVDNRSAAVGLTTGMVVNRGGTAIYLIISALFLAQAFGISVGIGQILLLALLALVASVFAAGTPLATLLVLPPVLGAMGLSLEQVALGSGLIMTIDWLAGRMATVVNVWSDVVGAATLGGLMGARPKTTRRTQDRKRVRQPRARTPRDRDRGRGRREPREPRGASRRTERQSSPRSAPARSTSSRPQRSSSRTSREESSPFDIKSTGTPVLDTSEEGTPESGSPRTYERTPSGSDRRRESSGGRSGRSDRDSGRSRASSRRDSRPQPRREEKREEKESPKPAESSEAESEAMAARLSPATVARELARVSEQLKKIDTEDTPEAEPEIERDATPTAEEHPDRSTPPETPEPEEPQRVEAEPSTEEVQPADEPEEPEPEPVAFGRTRHHRGAKLKAGEVEEKEDLPEVDVQESFSSENVSFGRTKRKRTR